MVEAQEMEYGGMEVLEGNGVDGRAIADLIGFSVGYAWLYATSGDPGGKGSGVVVAPNIFSFIGSAPILPHRGSAEFSAPDD